MESKYKVQESGNTHLRTQAEYSSKYTYTYLRQ